MEKPEIPTETMIFAQLMAQVKLNLLDSRILVQLIKHCPYLTETTAPLAANFADKYESLFEDLAVLAKVLAKENGVDISELGDSDVEADL